MRRTIADDAVEAEDDDDDDDGPHTSHAGTPHGFFFSSSPSLLSLSLFRVTVRDGQTVKVL